MANSTAGPLIVSGEKTVAAAGTAEALVGSELRVRSLTIIAKAGNTNNVYVGGSDVASGTNDGLAAGDSLTFSSDERMDLQNVFIDVDTNGEGVDFYAIRG